MLMIMGSLHAKILFGFIVEMLESEGQKISSVPQTLLYIIAI